MNPFAFTRAATAEDAVTALSENVRAQFIAGGTNVLDLMKDAVEVPEMLVDINALPLAKIECDTASVRLGALARMSDVAAHPGIRAAVPMLALALDASASPQLRNMASMGGNILQRTRCPYFRDVATACNKREPGSGCGAIGGMNRMEAVLGTSEHCIATHASDAAVVLAALDTVVQVTGAKGSREIPFARFYRLPGDTPHIENALEPGELITGITIPLPSFAAHSTYLKARNRAAYEFALASAAVAVNVEGGVIQSCRIALGGIATIPWRSHEAENALNGAAPSRESYARAAEAALANACGYGQNDFKIPLAKRTLVRALEIAAGT